MASGIDFGILQPIRPTDHVVAQIHPQESPTNSLASGIMSGLKDASEIQKNNATTGMLNEKTAEDKALFPDVLQQTHNATEESNLKLVADKQDAKDNATLRAAALQGPDVYAKTLYSIDPKKWEDYQGKLATIDKQIADTAKVDADTAKEQFQNYQMMATTVGQIGRTISQIQDPQTRQRAWTFMVSQQPPAVQAAIAKMSPDGPDNNTLMAMSRIAHEADMAKFNQELNKAPTELMKNLAARRVVVQRIQTAYQNKQQPDPQDLKDLDSFNQNIAKDPKNKEGVNPEDTAVSSEDKDILKTQTDRYMTTTMLVRDTEDAKALLDKIPKGYTGPIINYFKANGLNSEVQELQKLQADIPLLYRNMVGMDKGVGRFTNAILAQLKTATGTTALNKDALQWVVDRVHDVAGDEANKAYNEMDRIRGGASNKDSYNNWKTHNPPPGFKPFNNSTYTPADHSVSHSTPNIPEGRVEIINPKGEHVHIPKEQEAAALQQGYKQVGSP